MVEKWQKGVAFFRKVKRFYVYSPIKDAVKAYSCNMLPFIVGLSFVSHNSNANAESMLAKRSVLFFHQPSVE